MFSVGGMFCKVKTSLINRMTAPKSVSLPFGFAVMHQAFKRIDRLILFLSLFAVSNIFNDGALGLLRIQEVDSRKNLCVAGLSFKKSSSKSPAMARKPAPRNFHGGVCGVL